MNSSFYTCSIPLAGAHFNKKEKTLNDLVSIIDKLRFFFRANTFEWWIILLLFLMAPFFPLHAQTVDFRGYVKELGSLGLSDDFGTAHYDNILHHRHETTLDVGNGLEVQIDLRTRILAGYSVENTVGYADYLAEDSGFADMSWVLIESNSALLHSTIDRLQLSYFKGPLEINLGRQRLNWGMTSVWSPNDLFNNFAYLDFDYEERPGSDALSVAFNWSYASSLTLGYGFGNNWDETVLAAMYRGNLGDYDIQAIAGSYKDQWMLGTGWSGYVKDAGFTGELSYFWREANDFLNNATLTASLGGNYMFSNGLYVSSELLYNGGYSDLGNSLAQLTQPPSPQNLFIEKTGYFVNASGSITPLISASLGTMGSFSTPMIIFIPQITFSLTEDIDLLVLSQLLKGKALDGATATPNYLFFRIKWSY